MREGGGGVHVASTKCVCAGVVWRIYFWCVCRRQAVKEKWEEEEGSEWE